MTFFAWTISKSYERNSENSPQLAIQRHCNVFANTYPCSMAQLQFKLHVIRLAVEMEYA